ncbi:MAG: diacylglycerol kinase family protein [Ruminococcaceae bacterium]|nr:diacylglycerol kinase family protein [Oscillospiraceae bacterium]
MKKYCVLYNPLSCNGHGEEQTKKLYTLLPDSTLELYELTGIEDFCSFYDQIPMDTDIIISGGDGTVNRIMNCLPPKDLGREVYYFATGTGNDFLHDIGVKKGEQLVPVSKYITNLPVAEIKGKRYKFLNNVGFGIDGYCCEIGDKQRARGKKKINYTMIAIKGLLGGYKKANATVIIDGVERKYKNVWLAPSMNGRYVGGGMMAAPSQDRLNEEGTVTVMVMHARSRFKTLTVFPSIFEGKHVEHTEMVEAYPGHEIEVIFDRPTALQVDGETITEVTSYKVWATKESRAAAAYDFAVAE